MTDPNVTKTSSGSVYGGNSKNILAEADPIDMDREFYKKPPDTDGSGSGGGIRISSQDYTFPIHKYKTEINKFVSIRKEDIDYKIGIITQCSVDRLNRLKSMVNCWTGIISVAVYIKNLSELFILQNIFDKDLKNQSNINIYIHTIYA
eukprot:539590_1